MKDIKLLGVPTNEVDEDGEVIREPCNMSSQVHKDYIKRIITRMHEREKEKCT